MTNKTKKRISKGLKRYHNGVKAKRDLKKLLWFIGIVMIVSGAIQAQKTDEMSDNTNKEEKALYEAPVASDSLQIIELTSFNPKAEQEVWLASFQACEKHGIDTLECASDLVAMAGVETGNSYNFEAIGDLNWGGSYGVFQINSHYHPHITREQAFDPYFSADWTLARMIKKGYKEDRALGIRSHNGGMNWRTLAYLEKVNKIALNN
jgi:hypothetical protein